jgi:4-hydroxy-tetrahydrodipicolinate reductase
MIRVAVAGASGKLGSLVTRLVQSHPDMEISIAIVSPGSQNLGKELLPGLEAVSPDDLVSALKGIDVYVDLTSPTAASENLPLIPEAKVNAVVGTTGISRESMDAFVREVKANDLSAVVSPNFSIGINVFWKTCESLAKVLGDYDVEIIEAHHNMKKDAPSGTAVKAAEIISGATGITERVHGRQGKVGARKREIGIHAVRAGDIVGEHTVIFAGKRERIELTHRAHSREAFAEGCLTAIDWVFGRRDGQVHGMYEVLGL